MMERENPPPRGTVFVGTIMEKGVSTSNLIKKQFSPRPNRNVDAVLSFSA